VVFNDFIKNNVIAEGDGQVGVRFCIPFWPCSLGDSLGQRS
jgi:hypothetical protein